MSEGKANAIPLYMQAGEELNRSMAEVVFKVVLLILMVTAATGWLIFMAGFGIFWNILAPSDAPLPATIGVSWTSVLSPMILYGTSAIPLYTASVIRIFLRNTKEKICSAIIWFLYFFYMLGMGTTMFVLALLLVGGLGDYLKNIFMLTQNNILAMAIGCLFSSLSYMGYTILWPLTQIKRRKSAYLYQELAQN